ncbi:MAG TPA: imelysin family protein [Noviherbaspirillum sp.]|jgi:predicted lipoprotein|uniref:imelysin family protein n=1 Tax=Noviherbaspirillum sp. TaxID=1926288 RepID=UPI002F95EEAD
MTVLLRRAVLQLAAVALLLPAAAAASAQSFGRDVAVPLYTPSDVVDGLYRHWAPPRAAAFVVSAEKLHAALGTFCAASPGADVRVGSVRDAWREAAAAWERLAAVPIGPLIERRSVRAIDFTPTRPQLIERAVREAPRGPQAMERIGTPAKGFPALEWLLWTKPVASGSQACAYAAEVAADIVREAGALRAAFEAHGAREWDNDTAAGAFTEFVNQWVGSAERLRWQEIERPVREARSTSRTAARFPRHASGATASSWVTHWEALRDLAIASRQEVPQPGQAVIPIELYLHGRGQMALAQRWKDNIAQADAAMRGLSPGAQDRLLAAAKRLASTKRLAEEEVAPALDVSIGFSDADGD